MEYIDGANKILKMLEDNGFEGYIVGGYVRDILFGIDSHDIDITTNARVDDLKKIFNTRDNGSKYSSVTVIMDSNEYEVTTYRRDVLYADHRHADIEITDNVSDDLKRRDYTINALLMDRFGNIIDEYDGRNDMENHIVRMIGDPYERYDEDALRILRGIYLVAKLEFKLSDDTFEAMTSKAPLLEYVSDGRKRKELDKIIKFNSNNRALKAMVDTNVFRYLKGLDKGILYMLSRKVYVNDPFMFYALAFKLNGMVIKSYEFEKSFGKMLEAVIKESMKSLEPVEMLDSDIEILKKANELKRLAGEEYIDNIEDAYNNLIIHSIKDVNVDKEALKEICGNEINDVLKEIASKILEGKLTNTNEEILRFVEKVK